MDKIDILLTVMVTGFVLVLSLMLIMWNTMNNRFEKVDARFDKIEEKILDIDRRMCRLEGAFASKDCCMIKESNQHKKAE